MKSIPQAVFFDFDGVILESAEIKTEAFLELFKEHTHLLPFIREHHINNMGVSRFKKFEWIYINLLKQPLSEGKSRQLGDDFSKIVFDKVLKAPFVPGALEVLKYLQGKSTCFVASGTPEDELITIIQRRNLSQYFDEVCGTPRTKSQIVIELLKKYTLDPSRCYFVGDANTDHNAARATGLMFIARNTALMSGYWSQQKDIWLVDSLQEVKDQLAGNEH